MIKTDTPNLAEYFRGSTQALVGTYVDVFGDLSYMLADAIEIADSGARSDIEVLCKATGGRWYDSTDHEAEFSETVIQALRYLDARGLIERDPNRVHIVRFPQ